MSAFPLLLAILAAPPITGEVVLPLAVYDELRAQADVDPPDRPPPVPSSIREAAYHVTANGSRARVTMRTTVDVLQKQPHSQQLLGAGAALVSLTVDGQPAGVVVRDGYYAVELKPGSHAVVMEVVVPVASEGPSEVHLDIPEAVASRLTADLPGTGLGVTVEGVPDVVVRRAERRTLVSAALPTSSTLGLSWVGQGEESEAEPEEELATPSTPGRARAVVLHQLSVEEAYIRGTVRVTLSVQKGTRAEAAVSLPGNVDILDVGAEDLREWNTTTENGRKVVRAQFKYARTGEIPITVRYERALGDAKAAPVEVPEPVVLDVEAERGFLGIETAPGVEVTLTRTEGAERLDGRDLPSELWSMTTTPLVLGVKYLEHPVNVAMQVSHQAKVAVADTTLDSASFETVINAEGRAVSAVNFHVRNHQRQYLEVKLPAETTVLSCFVNGKPVRPARGGQDTLFIPLDRSTVAEGSGAAFPVELVITQNTGKLWPFSRVNLQMPATSVQAMDLSWRVYVPATHTALSFGGNFSSMSDPSSVRRWLSGVFSAVPDALAGDSLEGWDYSQGVKARFAQKREEANLPTSVRVSRPLVGRVYDFRANLLRAVAPEVSVTLVKREWLSHGSLVAMLMVALGALMTAERIRRRERGMAGAGPALMIAGLGLGLSVGLYLNGTAMRLALAAMLVPAWLVTWRLRDVFVDGKRRAGKAVALLAGGVLGLALMAGALSESVVGAGILLLMAQGLGMLASKWSVVAAGSAAPPSGTPVAGVSTEGGAQ
ncbi:MAG: hypothetical protein AB2A00_20310 [Myxococcota bacterium]